MKKIFLIFLCFFGLLSQNYAQNLESDAVKFGTNNNEGTSRSIAVGGAFSAVGGDISNITYNPAGIAVYKSSVLSFTPSIVINKNNAQFLNSSFQNQQSKFNISSLGGVFNFKVKKYSIINGINLGVALNNQNNFNEKIEIRRNTPSTITNIFVNEAIAVNGNNEGLFDYNNISFETVGAYYTYLVNFDTSINSFTTPINAAINQSSITETKGGKRDVSVAIGFNLLDKLYLGGAISLPFINYFSTTTFRERDENDNINSFEDFRMINEYKNSGSGLNAKIGFIYKPVNFLRFSGSIQTQTRLRMTEEYNTDFVTNFDTVSYEDNSILGTFTYSQSTPWRANAGLALVHKKLGFISFDYELVDYSSMKFFFNDDFDNIANELNIRIKEKYQIAHNFKIGKEVKIKKFRIRAGYNIQTSPLKDNFRAGKFDFSRQQFSGGIGYLWERIALDIAYRYSIQNQFALSFDGVNGINQNTNTQLITASLGIRLGKK